MLMRHGKPWTAAASDDIAALIDQFERELNDGPCLDAINDESAFVDTDLTDGSPWLMLHGRVPPKPRSAGWPASGWSTARRRPEHSICSPTHPAP